MIEADEIVRLLVDCLKEVTAEQAEAGVAAAVNRQVYSSSSPTADAENTLPSGGTSRKRTATDESSQDFPVVQVPSPISSNPPKRVKYDL